MTYEILGYTLGKKAYLLLNKRAFLGFGKSKSESKSEPKLEADSNKILKETEKTLKQYSDKSLANKVSNLHNQINKTIEKINEIETQLSTIEDPRQHANLEKQLKLEQKNLEKLKNQFQILKQGPTSGSNKISQTEPKPKPETKQIAKAEKGLTGFIKKRPLLSVGIAAGVPTAGFLASKLFGSKHDRQSNLPQSF
jgi:ElaB/YqjD/DUF883 family membrane-anchored ribosome-binding protein